MRLYDSHNHLQDHRLDPFRTEICAGLEKLGVAEAVVNGTQESDWEAVANLARYHPWIRPSFGLHPWFVATRTDHWRDNLARQLDANPRAVIGEVGLDRWIDGHDISVQLPIFVHQLTLAAERNLPVAIHCLKAWGALQDALHQSPPPERGFLLHSYGGPAEMVEGFTKLGAYFSFSPYFLRQGKERQRDVFRQVPLERLLVETDAPDMAPPDDRNAHPLRKSATSEALNHPANLAVAYAGLAEIRGVSEAVLAQIVEENYQRLFGE